MARRPGGRRPVRPARRTRRRAPATSRRRVSGPAPAPGARLSASPPPAAARRAGPPAPRVRARRLADPAVAAAVVADRPLPARAADMRPFPDWLDAGLRSGLEGRGVTGLYSHQAEAIEALRGG